MPGARTAPRAQSVRAARRRREVDRDLETLTRIRAGDAEAFGELYRRHVGAVHRYLCARLPDPAAAEDLTSETFARALRYLPNFVWQGYGLQVWLMAIARNLLIDHRTSMRVLRELPIADVTDLCESENDVEERVFAYWPGRARDVADAAGPDIRDVSEPADSVHTVEARFVQDCDLREVAAQLGLAEVCATDPSGEPLRASAVERRTFASPSAEEDALRSAQVAELYRSIAKLRPRQRECLILRQFRGMSVAEAAAAMELSESSVKMMHLRSIRGLTERMLA